MTANRQSIDMKLGVSFDFFWHSIYSSSHSIRQYVLCLMLFLFPIFCVSGAKNVNSLTDSHKVNSRLNWGIEHWAQAYNNRKTTADISSIEQCKDTQLLTSQKKMKTIITVKRIWRQTHWNHHILFIFFSFWPSKSAGRAYLKLENLFNFRWILPIELMLSIRQVTYNKQIRYVNLCFNMT